MSIQDDIEKSDNINPNIEKIINLNPSVLAWVHYLIDNKYSDNPLEHKKGDATYSRIDYKIRYVYHNGDPYYNPKYDLLNNGKLIPNPSFFLETVSVRKRGIDKEVGWLYKYPNSNTNVIMSYIDNHTNLPYRVFGFRLLHFMKDKCLENELKSIYKESTTNKHNKGYATAGYWIPISELMSRGYLMEFSKDIINEKYFMS